MIRAYLPGDEVCIAALEKECFSKPWSENAVLESAKNDTLFFLFEENGKVLGYGGLQVVLDEGYVTNIAVTSKARGRGIGKTVTAALLTAAKEKNLSFVSLEVRVSNTVAISLYEGLGFKTVGKRKNFYAAPKEDALIMTTEGF